MLPPFVILEVKLTVVPAQTEVVFALMEIVGVTFGTTSKTILFDIAVLVETQVKLEVRMTHTESLSFQPPV